MTNRSSAEIRIVEREKNRRLALTNAKQLNPWALLGCLLVICVGLVIIWTGHWRKGSFLAGCGIGLAGVLRGLLPEKWAGLLVNRSRAVDCILMIGAGLVLVGLTLIVPHSPPGDQ